MNWETIWNSVSSVCISLVFKVLGALVIFGVGRTLIRFFIRHFPKGSDRHPLDPTARQFLMNIVKAALYTLLAIVLIGILGVPLASVITVLGTVGAAIALALQGSLGNLASGIMLLIFKPFRLGDYVETSDASGTVTDLGLFYTTLVTTDNCHYTVPNSSLTASTIKNYSVEKTRRLELVFAVDHKTDIEEAKKVIAASAASHAMVLREPAPFVRITSLDASLNLTLRVWCRSEDFWNLKFDLTEQIKTELDAHGIEIHYPQLNVHVKS